MKFLKVKGVSYPRVKGWSKYEDADFHINIEIFCITSVFLKNPLQSTDISIQVFNKFSGETFLFIVDTKMYLDDFIKYLESM